MEDDAANGSQRKGPVSETVEPGVEQPAAGEVGH
jgi:hypothetical protein